MTATPALLAAALLLAIPFAAAQAACDTEAARSTTQIRYAQAMANWQQNDPAAYQAAQEQLQADAVVARRGGTVKQCQFWEKAIRASHKAE